MNNDKDFTAVLVLLEDKTYIQDLRLRYRLPEKYMLKAILELVSKNEDQLQEIVNAVQLPKRRKKIKEAVVETVAE